jgi:hypothetical protein
MRRKGSGERRKRDRTHTRSRTQSHPREEGRRGEDSESRGRVMERGRSEGVEGPRQGHTCEAAHLHSAYKIHTRTHNTRACAHARAYTHTNTTNSGLLTVHLLPTLFTHPAAP